MEKYCHSVKYYETDRMGFTHHSNYVRWMEEARVYQHKYNTFWYPFDYTRRLEKWKALWDARDLAERMKAAMTDNAEKVDVDLLYASVGVYEGDVRTDYIIPLDGRSEETFKAAFPNYDEYNGTAYIFRLGLGRKTKFVPGMTDFLGAHPQE